MAGVLKNIGGSTQYSGIAVFCAGNLIGLKPKFILISMRIAFLSEFKANLSRFVCEVRRVGEVQILDGGTLVARLVPPVATDSREVRERLVSQAMLRPGAVGGASILDEPPLALPVSISEALAEDRNDRL